MAKHVWWLACVMALANAALIGCGDDDGGGDDEPDSGAPMAGAGGAGGSGGTGGAGGAGGAGGSGAVSVPCGSATCTSALGGMIPGGLPIPIMLPAPCCLDEATGACGMTDMAGMCQEPAPPAVPDASCPGISVLGMTLAGCCIDGMCGTDATLLGMGCRENGAAKAALASSPLGGFIMIPDPQACGAGGDDGGTEDGGN